MDAIAITRYINLILAITSIISWIYFYRRFREPAAITALSWLVNLTLYLLFRLFTFGFDSSIKNTYFLNLWSSLLQTHGVLLLLFGVSLAFNRLVHNKTYMDRLAEKIKKEAEQ